MFYFKVDYFAASKFLHMALLKYKSKGPKVKELQELLNEKGFNAGTPDGVFGRGTERAIKAFQRSVGLEPDGKVGNMTWKALEDKPIQTYPFDLELDVTRHELKSNEYFKEVVVKDTIYLHHTAGGPRPDYVIDGWERDKTRRGRVLEVGTAFVIGGKTEGDKDFDGLIYIAFDPKYWAHHLGTKRPKYAKFNNARLNAKSIAIEICSFGALEQQQDGQFYFDLGSRKIYVPAEEVCILDKPWRGKKFFQKYTTKQLEATKKLILELARKYEIPLEDRVYNRDWFDLKFDALQGAPGLWTHCNVREDKIDCFPQPELIDMLNSLYEAVKANAEAETTVNETTEPATIDTTTTDTNTTDDDKNTTTDTNTTNDENATANDENTNDAE